MTILPKLPGTRFCYGAASRERLADIVTDLAARDFKTERLSKFDKSVGELKPGTAVFFVIGSANGVFGRPFRQFGPGQ